MTTRAKAATLTLTGTRMLGSRLAPTRDDRRRSVPVRLGLSALTQTAQPEDEHHEGEEGDGDDGDDVGGIAQGRRHRVDRGVAQHAVDVPVLTDAGAGEAHETHEPGEGD